jgi:hypothetical protein
LVSNAERIFDKGSYFSQVNCKLEGITTKHQDDFSLLFSRREKDSPTMAQIFSRRLLSPKVWFDPRLIYADLCWKISNGVVFSPIAIPLLSHYRSTNIPHALILSSPALCTKTTGKFNYKAF